MSERPSAEILDMLFDVIDSKRNDDPETSYTAQLLSATPEKPARKLAEEATETLIEAIRGDSKALAQESADLLYHLLVVWVAAGLKPSDIWSILADRQGLSGIVEKQNRITKP
jgi:phosphoribosyl-ATP pyrophosphohydrolase